MKPLTALIMVAAVFALTSCTGFLGLEYDSKKYMCGANHVVRGQYVAGMRQGDGDYKIVIASRGPETTAWVERDGKYVANSGEPWRMLRNPWWPFPYRTAIKRGTPRELGLCDDIGEKRGHRWLLSVVAKDRIVARHAAIEAMYGNCTVATNEKLWGGPRYWLECTVDGKRYAQAVEGVYRYHWETDNPAGKGWVEQWRGTLEQYEALGKRTPRDPLQAKAAQDSLKILETWWWPVRHKVMPAQRTLRYSH